MLAALTMGARAAVPGDLWQFTKSYDQQGCIIYKFKEAQVTLPPQWEGKYGMESGDTYIAFYHRASREALTDLYGEIGSTGGILFSLCYSEDYDFMGIPSYEVVGSGAQGVYYVAHPTDVEGFTDDEAVWEEWLDLSGAVSQVVSEIEITGPGEGTVDTGKLLEGAAGFGSGDYIVPDSSSRELSAGELAGLNGDQLQMAINEIYARHGRRFVTESIQEYFDAKPWYTGNVAAEEFDENSLSETEEKNIAVMLQCMNGVPGEAGGPEEMVTTDDVNIRSTASTDGDVLGTVLRGSRVEVTGDMSGGWFPVSYDGIQGFISGDYLEPYGDGSSQVDDPYGGYSFQEYYAELEAEGGSIKGTLVSKDKYAAEIRTDDGRNYSFAFCQWTVWYNGDVGDYVQVVYLGDLEGTPQVWSMVETPTEAELADGLHTLSGVVIAEGNDIIYVRTENGGEHRFDVSAFPKPGEGDYVTIQYKGSLRAPQVVSLS